MKGPPVNAMPWSRACSVKRRRPPWGWCQVRPWSNVIVSHVFSALCRKHYGARAGDLQLWLVRRMTGVSMTLLLIEFHDTLAISGCESSLCMTPASRFRTGNLHQVTPLFPRVAVTEIVGQSTRAAQLCRCQLAAHHRFVLGVLQYFATSHLSPQVTLYASPSQTSRPSPVNAPSASLPLKGASFHFIDPSAMMR